MTIIIFLVDTSASMNQRTYLGTTLLDVAKSAVETFMKIRSRDPNSRWDRYMLLTYEDPPGNIKAGWKESHATFMSELRNMKATGLTSMGPALKHTFDLLNVNRMQTGIDTYGQGRCPFFLEPAMIICITDGRKITTQGGAHSELTLPSMLNIVPGSELTKEPFRWDQRLFSLVLRIPATPPADSQSSFIPSADDAPIDVMCEVTGGRSYCVTSQRMLIGCLESLVQKCQNGVVINFEKIGPDPPLSDTKEDESKRGQTPTPSSTAWHNCRKMIFVPRSASRSAPLGHWPIPEAFWPDGTSTNLAPRDAQPIVKFSCTPCDPMALENFPFDKYEMEPSPLTQYILERRSPNTAWQVFVGNSAKYSDIGHPFGYLKAASNLQTVNLFVMPYNYPALLPLLGRKGGCFESANHVRPSGHVTKGSILIEELQKVLKMKPTQLWRQKFDNYLKTMPIYYAPNLKRALSKLNVINLVPDQLDATLNYAVVAYLKKVKNQAKVEHDRLVASVGLKGPPPCEGIKVIQKKETSLLQRKDFKQLLEYYGTNMSYLKQELTDYNAFMLAVPGTNIDRQPFKNPYDISRGELLDQVTRMRANFLNSASKLQQEACLHNQPVQVMGNYQEYLKRMTPPLRELEVTPVRQHTFGNPFKVDKNLMIDEADEAMPGQAASKKRSAAAAALDSPPASPRPNKRERGPLPRDVPVSRLLSPTPEQMGQGPDVMVVENHISSEQNPLVNHLADLDSGPELELEAVVEPILDTPLTNGDVATRNGTISNNQLAARLSYKEQSEHNKELRKRIIKEVKRPGKNYDNLFNHLNTVQGTVDMKCLFVRGIIHEALRFKKRTLAHMLEQFEQSIVKLEGGNKVTVNNNGHRSQPVR